VTVLLDTGPIVAMIDRRDPFHRPCTEAMHAAEGRLVTCEAVLAETCHLLRHLPGAAQDVLFNVSQLRFAVEYRAAERADVLAKLMAKYADVPMDLADACLVDMAGLNQTEQILTLDGDFRIYRWDGTQPFELLLDQS
jgi:predicted nucleic acid-binding protein